MGNIWFSSPVRRILSSMDRYKVLVIDDHPIVLQGLRTLITHPFEVTASTSSPREALELLKTQDFDILVTDYQMPELGGLEMLKAARAAQPDIRVIVLSMYDDPSVVKELWRAGAMGYVLKKDTHHALKAALEKVAVNKKYLSDDIADMLMQESDEGDEGPLTTREIEIVKLIVKEHNSRQIAEILFISERTVETHRKNILRKTGTTNLVGLIKYAYANGLVKQ